MDSHFSCLYFVIAGSRSTECSRTTYFNEQTSQSLTAVEEVSTFPLVTFNLNLSESLSFALGDISVRMAETIGLPMPGRDKETLDVAQHSPCAVLAHLLAEVSALGDRKSRVASSGAGSPVPDLAGG